ncbi:MAG: 2-amino-4-hydroxy-6-hydroxymethyldihydropteridine diphosphokinase [Magnetospiraceae bacterium]
MILVALGANLPSPAFGPPKETLEAALRVFPEYDLEVLARSPWYHTAPVPISDQSWFVNGVVSIATSLAPHATLVGLQAIEERFGRVRSAPNAARTLDLDLLAYGNTILMEEGNTLPRLTLPHPRLGDRAFVLYPLRDVAPGWRHPVSGESVDDLVAALPQGQEISRLPT